MLNNTLKKNLKAKAKARYRHANRMSQGALGIVVDAARTFSEARAPEAAASIAYYALFSLFPLLFFLVALSSSVLKSELVQQQILDFVREVLPTARELVQRNIEHVVDLRGAVGLAGTAGLLWSATAVFTALAHNVNRAWRSAGARNFLKGRLVALIMAGSLLALLLLLSLISTTAFNLLPQLSIPLLGDISIYRTLLWRILSRLIPWLFMFAMFLFLYRWVPTTEVKWSEANWGALVAASAWEITRTGFGWYLSSGLARYQLVYGSLGAVVALMLWIYFSSLITLFGAHLCAAIAQHSRPAEKRRVSKTSSLAPAGPKASGEPQERIKE